MLRVELTGTEKLKNKFLRLGKIGREALKGALNDTAIEATSKAVEDEKAVDTGRLRSSIHFETPTTRAHRYKDNKGRSYDGSFAFKPREFEVYFGTNVEYALRIEYKLGYMKAGRDKAVAVIDKNMINRWNKIKKRV